MRARIMFGAAQAGGLAAVALSTSGVLSLRGRDVFPLALVSGLLLIGLALGAGSRDVRWCAGLGGLAISAVAALEQYVKPDRLEWLSLGLLGAGVAAGMVAAGLALGPQEPPLAQAPPPPIGPDVPPQINAETVEVTLENVRSLLGAENERAQSLNARGTGLAGFAGIIVSLLGALGRDLPTHPAGHEAAITFFLVSLVLLVIAVGILIFGVLRTSSVSTISLGEVQLYAGGEFASKSATWARGRTMATLTIALGEERRLNNRKARWLDRAYTTAAMAIVSVAVAGSTLVL